VAASNSSSLGEGGCVELLVGEGGGGAELLVTAGDGGGVELLVVGGEGGGDKLLVNLVLDSSFTSFS
jgi:hypothetical protein